MHGPSAKPEAALQPPVPPSRPADASSSPPRRSKPRHVIYKSSALQRAAPSLVAAAAPAAISATRAIQRASDEAEKVRDQFKLAKCGPEIDVGDGDDEATNAKKYERRLLMNRHSAAASRVRREAYTKALEAQLVEQEAILNATATALQAEKEKNRLLLVSGDDHMEQSEDDNDDPELQHDPDHMFDVNPFIPVESQTEDNGPLSAAVVSEEPIEEEEFPPQQAYMPLSPKNEDVLFPDPVAPDMLNIVPDDRLLDCFLQTDGAAGQVEFDSLDFL